MKRHTAPPATLRTLVRGATLSLLGLALAACSERTDTPVTQPDLGRVVNGEGMLNVGGYKLYTTVHGRGTPTVVLMSGLAESSDSWSLVRPEIARWAKVVTYDRGGVDRSELPRVERRSAEEVAAELETLLERADAKPPYILVAHSLAGYYARVFAARNPKKVAGLVFLDAQHEVVADMIRTIPGYEEHLRAIAETLPYPGSKQEFLAQLLSADQARAAGSLPRVPVAAVTFMDPTDPESAEGSFLLHGDWVAQGSTGLHLTTEAGHRVPLEDPAMAVQAIRWTLERAKR